ncbi:MAG: O-antigen ligase family protein [Bacteroidota bacterium]
MSILRTILYQHRAKFYFVLLTSLFMAIVWFATKTVNFYLFGFPLVIIFGYMCLTNFRLLWYMTVFLMPLSISDPEFFGKIAGVTFPTDFLAIMLVGIVIFKMLTERDWLFEFKSHPIPLIIGVQLLWLIFTATASDMPVVSWKYFAAYFWLLFCFYFLPTILFREKQVMFRFFHLIAISFVLALGIILFLYVTTGRNPFGLRFNPGPFFVDHTVFGAFTAMWVPILIVLSFRMKLTARERLLARGALVMFILGLFFSYSRGAWASCVLGLLLMGGFLMGKWLRRIILPSLMVIIGLGGYLWYAGQGKVRAKNDAVSRKSLTEHIASVTNFRTDFSNAERINRWYCAWEMFKDKPISGFGPGTYAFVYGDYQKAHFRTPVSTNRGDNGTAHNEFLLVMSEGGFLAGIILLIFFIIPIWCGMRGYRKALNRNTRLLYLAITFALITYDIHAFVNNFLDQDKVGGTYLALLAMITVLDLHITPKENQQIQAEAQAEAVNALT